MIPAIVIAAGITSLIALALGPRVPNSEQLGLIVFQGSLMLPAAIALIATAPRFVPAPEVSLITRLEMILGPIWVWAFLGENVSAATLVGGTVVLAAVAIQVRAGEVAAPQHA